MIKCDDTEWMLPLYGRNKKGIDGEIWLHVGILRTVSIMDVE